MGHLHEAFAAACPVREAQAAAADRALRRAADRTDPPPVLSRAEQIIAEGHARRVAYRKLNPNADTAMVYGAQIGYLHGQVQRLAAELDHYAVTRHPALHYRDAETDVGTVTVGYAYEPGEADRITSAAYFERTGDPGNPGYPASVDVQEVWLNGADVYLWVPGDVLDKLADEVLHAHEAMLLDKSARDACRWEDAR